MLHFAKKVDRTYQTVEFGPKQQKKILNGVNLWVGDSVGVKFLGIQKKHNSYKEYTQY